jgi:GGDEF domain-containing protein
MQYQQINLTDADVFEQEIQLKIDDTNGSLSVFIVDMSGISKLFTRSGSSASASFLRSVAQLLVRVCREGDKVYRIGDCTFGIVFDGIDSVVMQQLAAEKIIRLYNTAVSELEASFKGGISALRRILNMLPTPLT